jgi:hypothetical protein
MLEIIFGVSTKKGDITVVPFSVGFCSKGLIGSI